MIQMLPAGLLRIDLNKNPPITVQDTIVLREIQQSPEGVLTQNFGGEITWQTDLCEHTYLQNFSGK